ncbi:MAG: CHASE2 domain-containing protein [Limisphaerales bacterium]
MKFKPPKRAPVVLAVAVLAIVCTLQMARLDFFERLEWMTYDLRAKAALAYPAPAATNLAFVSIGESGISAVQNGYVDHDRTQKLGFKFGLYWPREVYGRLVDELSAQQAKAVAFDVLFKDLRPDQQILVEMADGRFILSDDYFALQLGRAGNAILGDTGDAPLPELFETNALAVGDITSDKDSDGVLRRVKAFRTYRRWHAIFQQAAEEYDLDLEHAKVQPGSIVIAQFGTTNTVTIPIDAATNFDLTQYAVNVPPGVSSRAKAFTDERVWQLGIVLAAQELKLDLANAGVDLPRGKIVLRGENGITRTIPVDRDGDFYIDWRLKLNDPRLLQMPIENLLAQNYRRLEGITFNLSNDFKGKLVVVGSTAQGNDLSDRGATPLSDDTFLVAKHWNIANSIITDQFIRRATPVAELGVTVLLGLFTMFLTLELPAFSALGGSLSLAAIYSAITYFVFIKFRLWLPVVFPVVGAIFSEHIVLVAYRVLFEQSEKRHIKSVFSKIVAPDIVNELLRAKKLALGGGRREVTVYFADVRGFTEFTDQSQANVLAYIREHQLRGAEAEAAIDEEAREALHTVNLYLGAIADIIIQHHGTLDKYIGDCVMAFWGAPITNEKHAAACVRAAIDAQRVVYELNLQRVAENQKRELENALGGGRPKSKLPVLMLGSGINTGMATVGLMGSDEHLLNYTVFGREVNLASRLEAVSGRARILISETTYQHLLRDDAELAARCAVLPPMKIKGFAAEIKLYEVSWRPANASPFDEELFSTGKSSEGTSFTGIIQRESN